MRALVLGAAGAICREASRDLAKYSAFDEIVLADGDLSAAQSLQAELASPRLRTVAFDADDTEALPKLVQGFDVVVNGLPYRYDMAVTRACVEAGVNGLDLSTTQEQFDFDEAARRRGVVFVPGVGATPGVTNLLVALAARDLDQVEEVDIAFAAFRCLAPAPGLLTTTLWEFNPEEPARQRVYFEDGEMRPAAPLSGGLEVDFGGAIGRQIAYRVPHPETTTLPRSYPGVRHVTVRGCFAPQVMRIMSALYEAGLLSARSLRLKGVDFAGLELIHALLLDSPASRENETWGYGLVVRAKGVRAGREATYHARTQHPPQDRWGGAAAYARNVGIPLAVGADLIGRGEALGNGVLAPEQAFEPDLFLEEIARRGITIADRWEEAE